MRVPRPRTGARRRLPRVHRDADEEILRDEVAPACRSRRLRDARPALTGPLGFDNSYALGDDARRAPPRLGIAKISDLAAHPELRFGFSNEFMNRADGWPGAARALRPAAASVRGIDHDLAYRALGERRHRREDLYTTDAEIARLRPARARSTIAQFFPRYDAVLLYRADLGARAPAASRRSSASRAASTRRR